MFRHFISLLIVVLCCFSFLISDAQAKRFGGGKSFGVSRSITNTTRTQPMSRLNQQATKNKWLAPLAGLAMGGLLASLFMGHGIGTGILSWLMIAGIALIAVSLLRNLRRTPLQSSPFHQYRADTTTTDYDRPINNAPFMFNSRPNDFDEHTFLRDAKAQFIRLQAAYDQSDLNDIRDFTTPEVFAEIKLQLQERGNALNQTDVVHLDARLLDVEKKQPNSEFDVSKQLIIASVEFSGQIREDNSGAASFTEIWHFQKEDSASRWKVAGIQQA